jgi:hypothetical protein
MTSVPDHSGKLIYQDSDDTSLKHEPTRRAREDDKRGRTARRQTRTRNAKVQRPVAVNGTTQPNSEFEDEQL